MKPIITGVILFCSLFLTTRTNGQRKFFVKGKIDGIADGAVLSLFRYRDGSIDAASTDTVRNGNFSLSDTASNTALYWILARSDNFPSSALQLWAAPGITVQVSGKGYLYKTWSVKSPLREQLEDNNYLNASLADWNKLQEIQIAEKKIRAAMRDAKGNIKDSLVNKQHYLTSQSDSVNKAIGQTQARLMQKFPVTDIWLNKMFDLAMGVRYASQNYDAETVNKLYERITSKQRESDIGKKITSLLFPSELIKTGAPMADASLLDIKMGIHQVSDYKGKGKYLLLDFGFVNCGACREAMPETKKISDSLQNKLTVIGINVDETAYWKKSVANKKVSWINLNDPVGRAGLAARYGVGGYPYYVIISPDGTVLGHWEGYSPGIFAQELQQYLH